MATAKKDIPPPPAPTADQVDDTAANESFTSAEIAEGTATPDPTTGSPVQNADTIFDEAGNDRIAALEARVRELEGNTAAAPDTGLSDRIKVLEDKAAPDGQQVSYVTTEALSNALQSVRDGVSKDISSLRNQYATAGVDTDPRFMTQPGKLGPERAP